VPSNRARSLPRGLQTLFHAGTLTGVTDGQLLERFALRDGEGSESAFAVLVERHGTLVWRTCRTVLRDEHEAADAYQATFLVLVRKAGSLWVRDSIAPWLHRVAFRAANQARRAAKRRQEAERRAAERKAGWTEGAMTDDLAEILHLEIDRLPELHRSVVVLCDLEERSYEEAARHLRCPVGTVQSRLARARGRLRAALIRRGVMPTAVTAVTSKDATAAVESPPLALTASTSRGSVLYAIDTSKAASVLPTTAVLLAEGVLRAMIRSRLQGAILVALAAVCLLVPAWLAQARQTAVERPGARAAFAGQKDARRTDDLEGNWIVKGYPGGDPVALVRIEGPARRPHARLLSTASPDFFDLARSTVDHDRIDERTVRFMLQFFVIPRKTIRSIEIVAYRPEDEARPRTLRGSWIEEIGRAGGRGVVFPVTLERTERAELDPKEVQAIVPGWEGFRQYNQAKDPAKKHEILERIIEKFGDTPFAICASWILAINRADAGAPEAEVRALIEQTTRFAARHGREMQIGAINIIVDNIIGAEEREGLILEYARKAVAMLHPDDPAALQLPTLKNLAAVLRKATRIDENTAKAELEALDDRIAALARRQGREPAPSPHADAGIGSNNIPWARSFAAARKQARAEGKLILLDFYAPDLIVKRLEADAFSSPEVAAAMRAFVPVKVDPQDGQGRPLAARYAPHLTPGFPTILFLDPANEETQDARSVGRIPGIMPAGSLVEQLNTIARLPREIDPLVKKAHPDDVDAMRQLATALAIRGRVAEAAALIDRAWGPGADPQFDRWAAVYITLGEELIMRLKWGEAQEWFDKAARVAKRPIDVYNAGVGAGIVALFKGDGGRASRELDAAARVEGVSSRERDFAKEWLGLLRRPPGGAAAVPEAAAAPKRLEADRSRKPGDRPPSNKEPSPAPK
jgi:RNA polymerase sigma factor (sigma-70 family)